MSSDVSSVTSFERSATGRWSVYAALDAATEHLLCKSRELMSGYDSKMWDICPRGLLSPRKLPSRTSILLGPNPNTNRTLALTTYRPGGGETICPPADGSSTRGGSTSVRGRVCSPHMAKLQAASVRIA